MGWLAIVNLKLPAASSVAVNYSPNFQHAFWNNGSSFDRPKYTPHLLRSQLLPSKVFLSFLLLVIVLVAVFPAVVVWTVIVALVVVGTIAVVIVINIVIVFLTRI